MPGLPLAQVVSIDREPGLLRCDIMCPIAMRCTTIDGPATNTSLPRQRRARRVAMCGGTA